MAAIASVFVAPIACNANTPVSAVGQLPCRSFIAEAATRFALPEPRLSAIIRYESGGSVRVISRAGAIGCMQLMPATWGEIRTRYALGNDAFDPHDNVLAGAAYLRELIDRYGWPGALAAYNAGPNRYGEFIVNGRALPSETGRYVAEVAKALPDDSAQSDSKAPIAVRPRWTEASIFVVARADPVSQPTAPLIERSVLRSQVAGQTKPSDTITPQPPASLLFVGQHR